MIKLHMVIEECDFLVNPLVRYWMDGKNAQWFMQALFMLWGHGQFRFGDMLNSRVSAG
jgi:hypothetical protein